MTENYYLFISYKTKHEFEIRKTAFNQKTGGQLSECDWAGPWESTELGHDKWDKRRIHENIVRVKIQTN